MDIKMNELKKALTSPVVLALLGLFIVFNLFIIYSNAKTDKDMSVVNHLVDKFGYQIDNQMMDELGTYYQKQLQRMNVMTERKISRTYESASDLFHDQFYKKKKAFTSDELEFLNKVHAIEIYYNTSLNIDNYYDDFDMMEMADIQIKKFGISGEAANVVRDQFSMLGKRLDQLIKNNEHKTLFFNGKIDGMHSLLFKHLFRIMTFEIMILVVLVTAFLMTYEFENKAHLMAYACKRGRGLDMDKLVAAIGASLIITTIILGVTFVGYFTAFDYSELWHVPISSYFNAELNFPYISWWNMSFITYLSCTVALIYTCQLFFSGITFIITFFVRNSYIVFLIFGVLLGLSILMTGMVPASSTMIFIVQMTPFVLILNPHLWFMGGWNPVMVKHDELYTVVIWVMILLLTGKVVIRKFKKQDID